MLFIFYLNCEAFLMLIVRSVRVVLTEQRFAKVFTPIELFTFIVH